MTIPQSAYPPPFNITRASHVVLAVRDLDASRKFYVDALGLVVSDEDGDALYLRGLEEACHHSLVLLRRDAAKAVRIGMRVYSDEDLEVAHDYFVRAGLPAQWVEMPYQGRTLHVTDAVGTPLELCARMDVKPRLVNAFEEFRAGAPQRLDHYQLLNPRVQQACDFYASLGFRMSEYIALDGTDDLVFAFLQRKGNPHDIVFANGNGPRLHHLAYTVVDASHVIRACDVIGRAGFGSNIDYGPGRHGPGHAMFVYVRDPDGHRIELFTTHYQVMDIENEPMRWELSYMKNRPWGGAPPQQWYDEASVFAETPVQEPENRPKVVTRENSSST